MLFRLLLLILFCTANSIAQMPPLEAGVSHELAKWRSARYSDVRYKLNLTLEKMSPVLKGTIEIRVRVGEKGSGGDEEKKSRGKGETAVAGSEPEAIATGFPAPIILDWRRIRGSESLSTISNISINGIPLGKSLESGSSPYANTAVILAEDRNEHLIFRDGVVIGENVIKLDFTSPILTSGSAITRYVDKEDGAEYIYSLFVPSDASTAFPVFDQPNLKARFTLYVRADREWKVVSNIASNENVDVSVSHGPANEKNLLGWTFAETKPISTYVFAFAAGPFHQFGYQSGDTLKNANDTFLTRPKDPNAFSMNVFVRKSQTAKFKPLSREVFRLNQEGIKFLESYFDYKFPFPKYDIVLIPEFPFGGMEHAGATFLRESSVIFPQEPTKNDYISRANVIFHEAAHQWFGDTVTMKWFDDLWLKEGFAEFMAYKTLEKVMPEYNAWKVFYERNKQAAYLTDSTKGTTPIYQEIANLNSAKSAYGNIVYRKAPSFLKQAEFYLGPDKFQTAVRAFLKKHEYANAGWEDLVKEFEGASNQRLTNWAEGWVKTRGGPIVRSWFSPSTKSSARVRIEQYSAPFTGWQFKVKVLWRDDKGKSQVSTVESQSHGAVYLPDQIDWPYSFVFANYEDYGYGVFLLDPLSRDYVLKNIGSEKDDFLRTMMWGSLWDSVRERELDPKEYVELVVKNLKLETDESTIQTLLGRVSTAIRYYIDSGASEAVPTASAGGPPGHKPARKQGRNTQRKDIALPNGRAYATELQTRVETLLIDRMQNASTPGQKITYYRSFLNIASSENARRIMKEILKKSAERMSVPPAAVVAPTNNTGTFFVPEPGGALSRAAKTPPATAGGTDPNRALAGSTKDRFDIVSKLIILGDPEAPKLLADLEKSETSDEAKRYAYAAKAGFATAENKAKFWNDFVANKDISESWIEAAFGPFNNVRHSDLTLPYLEKALAELPNLKRSRKIFFVNGWLGAFIGGQKSEAALAIVNKFLADKPGLDNDLRLKILENVDAIERAVKIRARYGSRRE